MEELLNQQLWLTIFETCDKEYLKCKELDQSDFKKEAQLSRWVYSLKILVCDNS